MHHLAAVNRPFSPGHCSALAGRSGSGTGSRQTIGSGLPPLVANLATTPWTTPWTTVPRTLLWTLLWTVTLINGVIAEDAAPGPPATTPSPTREILIQDSFDRDEPVAGQENIGNGWATNSRARARGNQQVDLIDGAMQITRHEVADHGVSVTHETAYKDATIELRFKIGPEDDLGINIADMKEKSVHAGHICMAKITTRTVELTDMKTGRMRLDLREANKSQSLTKEQRELIATKSKKIKHNLDPSDWHDLKVTIQGDRMQVAIDGENVGSFESPGIGHPTKSRLRLAVNRSAMVDDVLVIKTQ